MKRSQLIFGMTCLTMALMCFRIATLPPAYGQKREREPRETPLGRKELKATPTPTPQPPPSPPQPQTAPPSAISNPSDVTRTNNSYYSTEKVTVFEHRGFTGRSQRFGPGTYQADRGQLNIIGNDTISSLKVPFGMTVDIYEYEEGRTPPLRVNAKGIFTTGDHEYVGDELNDKTSWIVVHARGSTYLWSNDPIVKNSRTEVTGGLTPGGAHIVIIIEMGPGDPPQKHWKTYTFNPIPPGCDVGVWEATRNYRARTGWEHEVKDGKLVIKLWVYATVPTAPANWVGVDFKCK